jgi:hypothetical protein
MRQMYAEQLYNILILQGMITELKSELEALRAEVQTLRTVQQPIIVPTYPIYPNQINQYEGPPPVRYPMPQYNFQSWPTMPSPVVPPKVTPAVPLPVTTTGQH